MSGDGSLWNSPMSADGEDDICLGTVVIVAVSLSIDFTLAVPVEMKLKELERLLWLDNEVSILDRVIGRVGQQTINTKTQNTRQEKYSLDKEQRQSLRMKSSCFHLGKLALSIRCSFAHVEALHLH